MDAQCARIGSGLDPTIRLTTAAANRAFVASADDTPGLLTDARLTAVLPEDGDYVVEISDSRYQGASRPVYRLVIGAVPMAEEVYPLGGRQGETIGLELARGDPLRYRGRGGGHECSVRDRPLPAPRSRVHDRCPSPRRAGPRPRVDCRRWWSRRIPSCASRPIRRSPPVRAVAPVVFNGRIDPPGDEDRFALGGDTRLAGANQGARSPSSARPSTPSRAWRARRAARDRECRRHDGPVAAEERPTRSRSSSPTRRSR